MDIEEIEDNWWDEFAELIAMRDDNEVVIMCDDDNITIQRIMQSLTEEEITIVKWKVSQYPN